MTTEMYSSTDITLFQDHELFIEEALLDIDTWLTGSLLSTLPKEDSHINEDRTSLLTSDIISVNSLAISSVEDNESVSYDLHENITLSTSDTRQGQSSPQDNDSEDFSTTNGSLSIISNPPIVYGAEIFPSIMSKAFNEGDQDFVRLIIAAYISDECQFQFNRPVKSVTNVGNYAIADFFAQTALKCPDAIIIFKGRKKIPAPEKKGYYLRVRTHMSGTVADKSSLCGAKETIAEYVSPKKSKADVNAIRLAEVLIRQQQKHMQIFYRGFTYLFINDITSKIENYVINLSLTSIRGAVI